MEGALECLPPENFPLFVNRGKRKIGRLYFRKVSGICKEGIPSIWNAIQGLQNSCRTLSKMQTLSEQDQFHVSCGILRRKVGVILGLLTKVKRRLMIDDVCLKIDLVLDNDGF